MNKLQETRYRMKLRNDLSKCDNELLCITYYEVKREIDNRNKKGKKINL